MRTIGNIIFGAIDSPWLMWGLILTIGGICLWFGTGCQSYSYIAPDGTRITINRLMTDAEIGKLNAAAPNGTRIELEGVKSDAENVVEAAVTAGIKAALPGN